MNNETTEDLMTPEEAAEFLKEFLTNPRRFFYGMDLKGIPPEILEDFSKLGKRTVSGMLAFQLDYAVWQKERNQLEMEQKAIRTARYLKTVLANMPEEDDGKPCLSAFRPWNYFPEGSEGFGYLKDKGWVSGIFGKSKVTEGNKNRALVQFKITGECEPLLSAGSINPTIMKKDEMLFLKDSRNKEFLEIYKVNAKEGIAQGKEIIIAAMESI